MEHRYRWLFEEYKMGTNTYSNLAGGILAGKYMDGIFEKGSRYDGKREKALQKY